MLILQANGPLLGEPQLAEMWELVLIAAWFGTNDVRVKQGQYAIMVPTPPLPIMVLTHTQQEDYAIRCIFFF